MLVIEYNTIRMRGTCDYLKQLGIDFDTILESHKAKSKGQRADDLLDLKNLNYSSHDQDEESSKNNIVEDNESEPSSTNLETEGDMSGKQFK